MSRPLRLNAPDLIHHVVARGNARMAIFLDGRDYERFLDVLQEASARHGVTILTYCLMPNHYHLVVRTSHASLSVVMQQLNGQYAQWWNRTHERVGHVFQGRFKAQVVQPRRYFLAVCRYVLLNPVRARLVTHAAEWTWSSYQASIGLARTPGFLDAGLLLAELGPASSPANALADLLEAPRGCPGVQTAIRQDRRVIGDRAFVAGFAPQARAASPEVPLRDRRLDRPALAELVSPRLQRLPLVTQIRRARTVHGYSVCEIARHLEMHRNTVWSLIGKHAKHGLPHRPAARSRLEGSSLQEP